MGTRLLDPAQGSGTHWVPYEPHTLSSLIMSVLQLFDGQSVLLLKGGKL